MIYKRKCKITFISHGATINTEENRLFDDETYPALNATGKYEIEKIAEWVKNKGLKIDRIYSSPALRTIQSAGIIAQKVKKDFETLNDLTSRKSGIWSGLSYDEIELKYPKMLDEYHMNPENFCPQGGETIPDFNKRISDCIESIIEKNLYKRLIIITHPEVIQSVIASALNIPVKNQFKVYIPTGSASQISYYEDFSSLVYSAYLPI